MSAGPRSVSTAIDISAGGQITTTTRIQCRKQLTDEVSAARLRTVELSTTGTSPDGSTQLDAQGHRALPQLPAISDTGRCPWSIPASPAWYRLHFEICQCMPPRLRMKGPRWKSSKDTMSSPRLRPPARTGRSLSWASRKYWKAGNHGVAELVAGRPGCRCCSRVSNIPKRRSRSEPLWRLGRPAGCRLV